MEADVLRSHVLQQWSGMNLGDSVCVRCSEMLAGQSVVAVDYDRVDAVRVAWT